jgi:hypothetical protein
MGNKTVDPEVRLYVGKSKSGKTHLALHQMKARRRVLIHDPNGEDALADGAVIVETKDHLLRLVSARGNIRICWRGSLAMPITEAFEWANRAAWAGEGFTVLWDEADRLCPKLDVDSWAYKLINAGRHRNVRVAATSRRPQRVPRDLTAAATRICAGKTTGARDLSYLSEYFNGRTEELKSLGKYEFLDWTDADIARKKSPFS